MAALEPDLASAGGCLLGCGSPADASWRPFRHTPTAILAVRSLSRCSAMRRGWGYFNTYDAASQLGLDFFIHVGEVRQSLKKLPGAEHSPPSCGEPPQLRALLVHL